MKVQCGQCPAKYAVSDERVHDRKVRIHCKRCGASIIVDGKVDPPLITSTPARPSVRPPANAAPIPENQPPPEHDPESRPSPRPVAHTIMGGLEAPAAERLQQQALSPPPRPVRSPAFPYEPHEEAPVRPGTPAEHRGLTDSPAGIDESRWRVALTKQDLRWMTTEEIVEAFRSGAVKLETFVFRAGMPTWVTLPEVPELAAALADASVEGGAALASLPAPRPPSSRPPPRKPGARSNAAEASFAAFGDLDSSEPLPFALVAQRANGATAAAHEAARDLPPVAPSYDDESQAAADAFEPHQQAFLERPSIETVAAESLSQVPDEPFAPMPFAAAQQASGSSKWVWVVVVVLLLAAAGAYLASRQGLKLF